MRLEKSYLTKNPCYKEGKKLKVKGLMLHSVGCPQPSAAVFIRNWNNEEYNRACVHAFIDGNTGVVYQTLPWEYRGWHAGDVGNNTHIGVEMCEPDCIQYKGASGFSVTDRKKAEAIVRRTYQSAVELFAYLCLQYKLDPMEDGVILSHEEGYYKGIASNHGDPEHLWVGLNLEFTMDTFRKAVKEKVNEENANKKKFPELPFLVQVKVKNLEFRNKPSLDGMICGKTGLGTFTIIEVKNGWGKLKSGAGWIYICNEKQCKVGKSVAKPKPKLKSVDEVAKEVIRGLWGVGADRKNRLTKAGYNYEAVQKRVNELMR